MSDGYIGTAKIIRCASIRVADVEPTTGNESLAKKESPRFNSPVRITITVYRQRLCDTDNIAAKAAIDGIVRCGILLDDSAKFVKEVIYRQQKVKSKEDEQTEILIEEY